MGSAIEEDPAAEFRSIAASFSSDPPQLADPLFKSLLDRIPDLAELPERLLDNMRATIVRTVDIALRFLAGRTTAEELREQVRAVSYRRARSGEVGMRQTLLAYEIGVEELLEVFSEAADSHQVDRYAARELLRCLQLVTEAVALGYQAAAVDSEQEITRYLEMLAGRRRFAMETVDRLADTGRTGPYDWCAVSTQLTEGGTELVRSLRLRNPNTLVGVLDGRLVLLGPAPQPANFPVPVGTSVVGADTAEAMRKATATAELAAHLGVARLDATANAALCGVLAVPEEERLEFARARLGKLVELPELQHTLAEYLRAHGAVTMAARALRIHRHTMDYRLGQIREIMGAELRDPEQRLAAELALFCLGRYP